MIIVGLDDSTQGDFTLEGRRQVILDNWALSTFQMGGEVSRGAIDNFMPRCVLLLTL